MQSTDLRIENLEIALKNLQKELSRRASTKLQQKEERTLEEVRLEFEEGQRSQGLRKG